jgi:hypothetical protein
MHCLSPAEVPFSRKARLNFIGFVVRILPVWTIAVAGLPINMRRAKENRISAMEIIF